MLVPKLDDELRGKKAGDILKFTEELPERFGERAGEEVAFQVLVKDAKKKVLPELTDEWVAEVSEFETVDALRDDVRQRLDLYARIQAQMLMRDQVLEAAAGLVTIDIPVTLVNAEMERRLHDVAHRLEEQGINMTIPQYLAAIGADPNQYIEELREHATQGVRADLALRAVIVQEEISATDDELDAEIARLAEQLEEKPAEGAEGSRTEGCSRGGTLGHRTRQGRVVPRRPRHRRRRSRQCGRHLVARARTCCTSSRRRSRRSRRSHPSEAADAEAVEAAAEEEPEA